MIESVEFIPIRLTYSRLGPELFMSGTLFKSRPTHTI